MNDIRYPSKTRRFMTEAAGRRRYHFSAERAVAAARGGVLWVAMGNGWTCQAERVARFVALAAGNEYCDNTYLALKAGQFASQTNGRTQE